MHDVITIGSATLDVFLCCDQLENIEHNNAKKVAFPYGEKLAVSHAVFETGGGATNTATTFSRQGLDVAIVAKIGNDFAGSQVKEKLQIEHINTQHLIVDNNDTTDFSTIIWSPGKGSTILVNRGEGKLEVSDVDWDNLQTKWFYISSVEGNLDILKQIESFCTTNSNGTCIAWNPGKREIEHQDYLIGLLRHITLLIINKKEASLLMNSDLDLENPEHRMQISQKLTSSSLLITDGHRGSYYYDGTRWLHAGIFSVDRQEATGAGDAFGSAFVTGLIQGKNIPDCLKQAAANSASVVTTPSAKKGILTIDQIEEWMRKDFAIEEL